MRPLRLKGRAFTASIPSELVPYSFSFDYVNSTTDAGLSADEFKTMVRALVDSVDMMKWIWTKGEDHETCDDQFLSHRKGMKLISAFESLFHFINEFPKAVCPILYPGSFFVKIRAKSGQIFSKNPGKTEVCVNL